MTVRHLLRSWNESIDDLRALSLIQPWASLMALGEKRIETRARRTHRRGAFFIHASGAPGGRWDQASLELAHSDRDFIAAWNRHPAYFPTRTMRDVPLGAILAVTRLVDCQPGPTLNSVLVAAEHRGEPAVIAASTCGITERAFGFYNAEGRYGFVTAQTHRLTSPIVCKGNRSFWRIPEQVYEELLGAELVAA